MAFPIIEKIEREQQSTLVQDLITTAHKSKATGVKAVLGFDATLDAVNQGRVYRLVYPTGLSMNGYHCTSCDVLLDHSPSDGQCPDHCASRESPGILIHAVQPTRAGAAGDPGGTQLPGNRAARTAPRGQDVDASAPAAESLAGVLNSGSIPVSGIG